MDPRELTDAIVKWGRDKNINNPYLQCLKMYEEAGEITRELVRNRLTTEEIKDGIGDTFVTLAILADILGYDVFDCAAMAYKEIAPRTGKTINGCFVKGNENG